MDPARSSGEVHDPMSQKSYMWNKNNPVSYSDPSGYLSQSEQQQMHGYFWNSFLLTVPEYCTLVVLRAFSQALGIDLTSEIRKDYWKPGYTWNGLISGKPELSVENMQHYLDSRGYAHPYLGGRTGRGLEVGDILFVRGAGGLDNVAVVAGISKTGVVTVAESTGTDPGQGTTTLSFGEFLAHCKKQGLSIDGFARLGQDDGQGEFFADDTDAGGAFNYMRSITR